MADHLGNRLSAVENGRSKGWQKGQKSEGVFPANGKEVPQNPPEAAPQMGKGDLGEKGFGSSADQGKLSGGVGRDVHK